MTRQASSSRALIVSKVLRCVLLFVALTASAGGARARVWNVYVDGSGDAPAIQAAVDSCAESGDTVLLGPGSHPGDGYIEIEEKSITLRSTSGADQTEIAPVAVYSLLNGPDRDNSVIGVSFRPIGTLWPVFVSTPGRFELRECTIRGFPRQCRIGGGLTDIRIIDCDFIDNSDDWENAGGGALFIDGIGPGEISGCRFINNSTPNGNILGYIGGGAIWIGSAPGFSIHHCLFEGNEAPSAGAIMIPAIDITVQYNTFVRNRSDDGAVVAVGGNGYWINNNIFAYNDCGGLFDPTYGGDCLCNNYWENDCPGCINDQWLGECLRTHDDWNHVFYLDPMFCAPEQGDYSLHPESPMLPGHGNPYIDECGPLGAYGVGCQPLPIQVSSWGRIKSMYHEPTKR